ncbi:MAG: 5'-nucleotidase C-terminal domain-containing protein, partial [Microbacterium sp.]
MMSASDDAARRSSPYRRRFAALTLATTAALAAGVLGSAPAIAADAPVEIDVVTINDFHGRIEVDGQSAGAAVLAGAVQQQRAANPNTIFAAAGDLIGASTFTSFILSDEPTIHALNAAGLDVSATGNHEFDQGYSDLRDRVMPLAQWQYINANVFLGTGADAPTAVAPSWVKEVDGVRVGFVGAVTEELDSLVSPAGIAGLDVRDIATSVNKAADALRDGDPSNGEADVVILLVHEGAATTEVSSITPDSPLGKIVYGVDENVDAIVSAHTHLAYNHVIDGRPVVSAGQYGQYFGLMSLKVDPGTKELLSISNELKPLTHQVPDPKDPTKKVWEPLYPAVPEVAQIVSDAKVEADVIGAEKVGDVTADFNRARQSDGKTENRGGESTLGNFVADVQKWSTGADIALMNPGGLRTDISYASANEGDPDGTVSYREAATVQPFANTLMTTELTGAQLKSVLEEQWQPADASRPFLKLGVSDGFSYTYDPTAAAGAHITSMTLNGAAVDPAATYLVGVNSFLAAGGDNFFTLAAGANTKDTGKVDLQSMVDWFSEHGTASPDLVQRAVGVVPVASGAQAGEQVSVQLSSLAFSAGEPVPGEATLSLGDRVLATAAVDTTVVSATDEGGRATLTFTVPAGVYGGQTLTARAGDTVVQIPVTFAPFAGTVAAGDGTPGATQVG